MKANYIVAIALTGLVGMAGCSEQVSDQQQQAESPYQYTGLLDSSKNSYLAPPPLRRAWNYEIKRLLPEGTTVTKDMQVAWLDKSKVQENLREDANDLKTRKQNLENERLAAAKKIEDLKLRLAEAKMDYERSKLKAEIQDVSVARVDQEIYTIEAKIAGDQVDTLERKIELERVALQQQQAAKTSEYERRKVRVDSQRRGMNALDVKADQEGVLVYIRSWDGEPIKSGSRIYRGQSIVRIADLTQMQVKLKIPERDMNLINFDKSVEIGIEADPEQVWAGTIKSVSDVYLDDDSLIYAEVVVAVDQPDSDLMRPGGKARVIFKGANDDA